MKKIIIILILFGFLLSSFGSTGSPQVSLAQPTEIELPETLEEAKEMGKEAGQEVKTKLPGILEKVWQEEILPLWQWMGEKAKEWWNSSLYPWLENIWQKIAAFFGQEVEKRKPVIEEEFEKEKEEMREDVPKVSKSLWERFKELIK